MKKIEVTAYRLQLEALTRRLRGEHARLQHDLVTGVGPGPAAASDARTIDDLSREREGAEVAVALLGNEDELLAECQDALSRIEAGTFGTCVTCGRRIGKGRLDAIPFARKCIRCARAE